MPTGSDEALLFSLPFPEDRQPADEFDWRNRWYPVAFVEDLPAGRPTRFTLHDEPRVLFVDASGKIVCLFDRCPHRAARLSDGQVIGGRLECLYHGWQFGESGKCLHIPQLSRGAAMPARADVQAFATFVRDGVLWVWNGEAGMADPGKIPASPSSNVEGLFSVTFQMDLPYDHTYLIENVIDIAHIHIAHAGVRGGGKREAAKPLAFDIEESAASGFRSRFQSEGVVRSAGAADLKGALVEFVAPYLVRYRSDYKDQALVAGLELYAVPLGENRCRLLYRKFSNFTSWRERWKPRWMEHLTQCKILEQDMAVVVGQSRQIAASRSELKEFWIPLRSSDRLVVEYRRWLDRNGGGLLSYRGFSGHRKGSSVPNSERPVISRSALHTSQCSSCKRFVQRLDFAMAAAWGVAALALAGSAVSPAGWFAYGLSAVFLLTLLSIAGMRSLRSLF